MNRQKMLQNPLPIDRVAARVVKKAAPEQLWSPLPKPLGADHVESKTALKTQPIPHAVPENVRTVIGKRRGRMTVIGYAAEQGGGVAAKWVVRCDCGNFEHRTRIFRWLGTEADDRCRECRHRAFKLVGEWQSRDKAVRATASQG